MDLRGIIQFWIKTAHTVWQTGLAEELKFPRLSREKCDRSVREAAVVCNNDYAQTIETIGNMEPGNTFYAKHLFCPVLVNENYWIMIQSCWS